MDDGFAGPGDVAAFSAGFGAALRAQGVPVGPERCARFARAVLLTRPVTTDQLYWCALATLISDPSHIPMLDRLFATAFRVDHELRSMINDRSGPEPHDQRGGPGGAAGPHSVAGREPGESRQESGRDSSAGRGEGSGTDSGTESSYPVLAAAAERLAHRDFAELTTDELAALAALMRQLRLATPPRRARRQVTGARGPGVDLRATLRQAGRTAGQPVRLRRRRPRQRPRRLVVLCDISGSMAPYARAMLQLLYGTAGGDRGEVFTFATRLTRLTRHLRRVTPAVALQRAGQVAPDWSGGTRIGASLKEFLDRYGARGMARGAVVVIVSDGWETGDPAQLGRQMARLSRLAYRIVWANPRTASPGYQPLAGGMAAAWPFCDAVVSAHQFAALDDLVAAVGGTRRP